MENNGISQPMNKRQRFILFLRCVSVTVVTVLLLAFLIEITRQDIFDFGPGLLLLAAAYTFFYITIPIIAFWLYSFVKAVSRRTKTDKVLIWFHIADLLILGISIYIANLPPQKCDAFIMAQYFKGENGFWMRNIAKRYRNMLPYNTRLCVEFDYDGIPDSEILSEKEMKTLKDELTDFCGGCIGIDINKYPNSDYSTLRFRRINIGMYSYRLYDHPLSHEKQDSINADPCLIVYDDSTVFEFSAGVLGAQTFPGKQEFLETQKRIKDTTNETAR